MYLYGVFVFLLQNSGNIRKTKPNETRMSSSIAVKIERTSALVEGRSKSKSGTLRSFRARTIAPHQLHGCLINRVELFYDTGCATIIIYCTPHRYPCCSDWSFIRGFSPIINHVQTRNNREIKDTF